MSLRRSFCYLLALLPTLLFAQEWVQQNPNQIQNELYDVSVDQSGAGWACGVGSLIYRSTDGGQSWAEVAQPPAGNHLTIAAMPGTNGQGVVVAGTQLYSSLDGGQTWTRFNPPVQTGAYNDVVAPSANALYALNNRKLCFKSTDGGLTWDTLSLPIEREWISAEFLGDSLGWLSSNQGDLIKTTDGGATWTVLDSSTYNDDALVRFSDPQQGYLLVGKDLYRSEDGGTTWTLIQASAVPSPIVEEMTLIGDSTILITQPYFIARSDDAGQNFQLVQNHPHQGVLNRGLCALPDGQVWATANWNSLLYSADGGLSYADQFPGFKGGLSSIAAFDERRAVAMGYEGPVLRTQDGGQTWPQSGEHDLLQPVDFLLLSEDYRILAGRTDLLWTDDGGQTWHEALTGASSVFRRLVQRADTFYAVNMNDGLYRSTDSGRTWTLLPDPNHGRLHDLLIVGDSLALLSDQDGLLWRSTDGLQSWDSLQIDQRTDLGRLSQSSAQDFWLLSRNRSDTLLHSQDRGLTWRKELLPRSSVWRAVEWVDSLRGYIVGGLGEGGYLIETLDGGQTWQEVQQTTGLLTDLALGRGDSVSLWAVGLGGTIYHLGIPADSATADTNTTALDLPAPPRWHVFPNPTADWLHLRADSPPATPLQVELYDLYGRRLHALRLSRPENRLDLRSLPAGQYWLRLRQGPQEEWHAVQRR